MQVVLNRPQPDSKEVGWWIFYFEDASGTLGNYSFSGTYKQAEQAAKRFGKRHQATHIELVEHEPPHGQED